MTVFAKLMMCMLIPGGFCLALALGDIVMNILCKSEKVQRWARCWDTEDDEWEDEE